MVTARTKHHIANTQAQPVRLVRVASSSVLVPRRSTEVIEQGSNAGLAFPEPLPTGFALAGNAVATGRTHLGSDGVAHALGTVNLGTASATGMVATATAVGGVFLAQESEGVSQAWGQLTSVMRAQSFEVDDSETLNVVSLKLSKDGSPTDNIVVEIRSNDTNMPSSTVLENSGNVSGATLTGTPTWTDFTLDAPLALSASTQYWIVVNRSDAPDNTNFYRWRRSSADIEAAWLTSTFTSSWAAAGTSFDFTFRLS